MTTIQPKATAETIKISLSTVALVYLARKLGRLLQVLIRSPAKIITALLLAAAWWLAHIAIWLPVSLAIASGIAAAWLAVHYPDTYQTQIAGRTRGTWRSLRYRQHWTKYLKNCGITPAPLLLRTNSTPVFDRLHIRMTPGQRPEDYANSADRLTHAFRALNCRISTTGKPQRLELLFLTQDPLINPVQPYPPEPDTLKNGLPIARTEDGKPWRLRLVGTHLLLVGASGAGKSGVLWAIIHTLIPAIDDGTVKLWVLDPKGGMELAGGRHKFDRFIYGHRPSLFADALDEAVQIMQTRQEALRGVAQLHTPTARQPLYVIMIDELAALTAWNTDRKAQQRIQAALALLQSQGRAVGVIVIGAVQDPSKATLPKRDLFTIRIALRLVEASQIGMVFGPGARDSGAQCDQIPTSLPGVGYVQIDGEEGYTRVRFAHVTPNMIGITKGELPPAQPEDQPAEPTGIFIA